MFTAKNIKPMHKNSCSATHQLREPREHSWSTAHPPPLEGETAVPSWMTGDRTRYAMPWARHAPGMSINCSWSFGNGFDFDLWNVSEELDLSIFFFFFCNKLLMEFDEANYRNWYFFICCMRVLWCMLKPAPPFINNYKCNFLQVSLSIHAQSTHHMTLGDKNKCFPLSEGGFYLTGNLRKTKLVQGFPQAGSPELLFPVTFWRAACQ